MNLPCRYKGLRCAGLSLPLSLLPRRLSMYALHCIRILIRRSVLKQRVYSTLRHQLLQLQAMS